MTEQSKLSELLLTVSGLSFRWPGHHQQSDVLTDIGMTLRAGEVVSLLGANGSGKSTLLRLLLGFLAPATGRMQLLGRDYNSWRRVELAKVMAYVPQSQQVPFPYRVWDLVAMGRVAQRGIYQAYRSEDRESVNQVLERLGIRHLSERVYNELSGGQQQLCLIARALVQQPQILLLDEPVTGLDYGNQWRLLSLIRQLADSGMAVIKTSHYPDHVVGISDRVLVLKQGRIQVQGKPQDVITARTLHDIYQLQVDVMHTADGRLLFVPELQRSG